MQVRRLLTLRGAPALLAINFFPWLTHKETSWMRPLPRFPRADAAATSASVRRLDQAKRSATPGPSGAANRSIVGPSTSHASRPCTCR